MQICRINNSTFKALSDQAGIRYVFVYNFENWLFSIAVWLQKGRAFLQEKKHIINLEERQLLPYYWWDKVFKGMVVNRALSSLSLKITLTVPLRQQLTLLDEYFNLISAKNGIITMSFELKHGNQCGKYFSRSF